MPKKQQTVNTKVASAKEKQAVVEAQRSQAKAQQEEAKEQQEWAKGADARGASRSAQAEQKAAEAARKAAEKARLLAEEEASLSAVKVKAKSKAKAPVLKPWEAALENPGKKKTRFEMEQEAERRRKVEEDAKAAANKNDVIIDDSEIMENTNRIAGEQWASGLDGALQELSLSGVASAKPLAADKFPEKRMKAAFKAYEEVQLPAMREDKPGLKLSQYKQLIFKAWQSSPENPMNQQTSRLEQDH